MLFGNSDEDWSLESEYLIPVRFTSIADLPSQLSRRHSRLTMDLMLIAVLFVS